MTQEEEILKGILSSAKEEDEEVDDEQTYKSLLSDHLYNVSERVASQQSNFMIVISAGDNGLYYTTFPDATTVETIAILELVNHTVKHDYLNFSLNGLGAGSDGDDEDD